MKIHRALVPLALPALLLGACADGTPAAPSDEGSHTVVAGFYPLAEIAERVGGDRVRVENLTPPGAEPHDIELDPRGADAVLDADVVLYLGRGFQPAVADIAERSSGVAVDVLEGTDALAEGDGHDHGGEEDDEAETVADPHVWLDPLRMLGLTELVEETLVRVDPAGEEGYAERADRYRDQLEGLREDFRSGLADCERRLLVTSHAAFGYLADRYDLQQQAVSGVSPEAEPDPRRLGELVDLVEEHGVTTVFTERGASEDVARTLARETGVSVATLRPIEALTADELEAGEDYASLMRDNLDALREALGCR